MEAFDLDEGRNADLLYQIVPNNPNFVIDTQSGEISLIGSLDRETESIVNLTVVVRDGEYKYFIYDFNKNIRRQGRS